MRGIKTKSSQNWKKMFLSIFLFLFLILLLNSLSKVYTKKKQADKTLAHMQSQVLELKKRNEELKYDIQKLKTQEGIEFEIRKRLNVAQIGESVAIVVENQELTSTSSFKYSSWQKFKNTLINFFK